MDNHNRCDWGLSDETYLKYHDTEWGRPEHDDRKLFEMLCLEGAQAGLSWLTILKRRDNYRKAFDNFDADIMANYSPEKIQALLQDEGIIRNRLKVNAFIVNARCFLEIVKQYGSFDSFIWQFVEGQSKINHWESSKDVPITTPESDLMSKTLKKLGFKFVGSTICYSYMQAMGMVNDHLTRCFCHLECNQ